MIQFSKGYTTPEQSKKLLNLGVPIDSADMYYKHTMLTPYLFNDGVLFSVYSKVEDIIPCWSVGRLIEIYHICDKPGCSFSFHVCFPNLISEMIYKIVEAKEHGWIDFSKLEE